MNTLIFVYSVVVIGLCIMMLVSIKKHLKPFNYECLMVIFLSLLGLSLLSYLGLTGIGYN